MSDAAEAVLLQQLAKAHNAVRAGMGLPPAEVIQAEITTAG
jgi:hypothetical protein